MLPASANVVLRALTEQDAATFAKWESQERPYPWSLQAFQKSLAPECPIKIFAGEENGTVVGFAAVQCSGGESYVSNLMVAVAHRRRGVGGTILEKVMIWSKSVGAAEMFLDVDATNRSAISLYRKFGFEIVDRRARSYPNGEDAIVMRKKL